MLFQLFVDGMTAHGHHVQVVDTTERASRSFRVDGQFTVRRALDYILVFPRLARLLLARRRLVYLTTAQSWPGFLRDALVIWPAFLLGHRLIAHQFGGNYGHFYSQSGTFAKFLLRTTMNRVHAIVVEAVPLRAPYSFLSAWETKVHAIPNGLPEADVPRWVRPKMHAQPEPFRLLFLSNMLEAKGYWDVLEAVRILVHERRRNIQCQFAGQWLVASDSQKFRTPELARAAFSDFLARNQLTGVVAHTSRLEGKGKQAAFLKAHVFLLPSTYVNEGQPTAIVEAMAYGLVTISTQHRLIPTMVVHRHNGFFVTPKCPVEIADWIEHLIDSPETYSRMSANAIEYFEKHFTAAQYLERMGRLVAATARRHRPRPEQ